MQAFRRTESWMLGGELRGQWPVTPAGRGETRTEEAGPAGVQLGSTARSARGLAIWGGRVAELRGSILRGWAQTSCQWGLGAFGPEVLTEPAIPQEPGTSSSEGGGQGEPLQSSEGKGPWPMGERVALRSWRGKPDCKSRFGSR